MSGNGGGHDGHSLKRTPNWSGEVAKIYETRKDVCIMMCFTFNTSHSPKYMNVITLVEKFKSTFIIHLTVTQWVQTLYFYYHQKLWKCNFHQHLGHLALTGSIF